MMYNRLMLGLLLVVLLLVVNPTVIQAQSLTVAEEVTESTMLLPEPLASLELYELVVTLLTVLVVALLAGYGVMMWITTGKIHQSLSPEMLTTLLPFMNLAGQLVAKTETEIDDRSFVEAAQQLGYSVSPNGDGSFTVVIPPQTE